MNTTPQPAVDAANELADKIIAHLFPGPGYGDEENSAAGHRGEAEEELAAIIACHYAPLVEQANGFEFALQQERNIHMTTIKERDALVERVKVLEADLADESKWARSYFERSLKVENDNDQLRARVAELNSKYASAEADGNSLREERERLITRVAELEKDRDRLDWLCDNPVQEISFGQFPQSIIFNGECFIDVRAAIDAARAKEDAT